MFYSVTCARWTQNNRGKASLTSYCLIVGSTQASSIYGDINGPGFRRLNCHAAILLTHSALFVSVCLSVCLSRRRFQTMKQKRLPVEQGRQKFHFGDFKNKSPDLPEVTRGLFLQWFLLAIFSISFINLRLYLAEMHGTIC